MENLKRSLELLFELQKYDTAIEELERRIADAPSKVEMSKSDLENKKIQTENIKKNYIDLNSARKEKEALLDSKEQVISKRSVELNSVKSNDAYKAILLEIDKAKADKSAIEDDIIILMMEIDKESAVIKNAEKEFKEYEIKTNNEISEIGKAVEKMKAEIKDIQEQREKQKSTIDKNILDQYERVRQGRGGQGICLVEKDACSACGTILRPQVLNQLGKCTELVFCDGCSRILLKE
ncbi:MAG: C4-type zinc ribbon domain-containing protein [Elusimicrobiota bacterium]|jgi:predicted  nucleic acid-binding Zn-ribbon protein|nr:C4-type zinc ribbon domain-containing protein [Elusimicrobiota bacterium]